MIPKEEPNIIEKVDLVKAMTKETFEALDLVEIQIDDLQKKKATLKRDLNDLKEGRLDRIEERHTIDPQSKEFSVFTVCKKIIMGSKDTSHWYVPYLVFIGMSDPKVLSKYEIHNSLTKINASGSYKLNNGKVCFL